MLGAAVAELVLQLIRQQGVANPQFFTSRDPCRMFQTLGS
jgi:hypothetical protein